MGLLIFILFLALAAGILALALYHEKKRREALERVAAQLGMRFSAQLPEEIRSRLLQAGFGLFERGHGRRFYNSMSKRLIDGTEITVFDYQYTSGSGKSSSTYRQSVFYAYHEDLHLPRFRLHPENALFHGIAKAFGMQDINFESHPKFSRSYLLRGENEAQVRLRFHPGVLGFWEQHPNYCAEGAGAHLILWQNDRQVSPEGMAEWMHLGEELTQRLRRM
ncbi:hypothetical protein CYB_1547 [Synechococcus sp. JA-2-3B'a(2-13)]|uniref:hypothetical protein n=1 Tax=Synechococcus sp. (strain JA-2-3B'a(2-13)) TaxID=321332 RepID=UPI0000694F3A|nr:hypothetical protein [Synechococcus sp. JA-2-3B'a(2-13)]ABD02511.1 hypothetical protein CYB_1547 [Synechococcus sp. JA-2-3B'a(2-13)]